MEAQAEPESPSVSPAVARLARGLRRLGWINFWLQLAFAVGALGTSLYVLVIFNFAAEERRLAGVAEYLSLIALAILGFTIVWSYRYTRLGRRMLKPAGAPRRGRIMGTLRLGVVAACAGIVLTIAIMGFEMTRILLVFMQAPQGGVPVIQPKSYEAATWVSAVDMVGLLVDLAVLSAEFILLMSSLWLLHRASTTLE